MDQTTRNSVGRFTLLEMLGSTGLATVYRARDESNGAEVVVKMMRGYFSQEQERTSAFFEEVSRVQELKHPVIVAPLEVGQDGQNVWLVSPHIPWRNLEQHLQWGRPLPLGRALAVLHQLAEAIDYAHQHGVMHQDVKPSNIFISDTGDVLITDFGTAPLVEGLDPLMRSTLNTPHPAYTSPELAQGFPLAPQCDVYSLAATTYEMLTGTIPHLALGMPSVLAKQMRETPILPSKLNTKLPPAGDSVLLRALTYHPAQRHETATAFADALEEVLGPAVLSVAPEPEAAPTIVIAEEPQPLEAPPVEEPPQQEAVYCPVCGQANDAESRYCQGCWAALKRRRLATPEEAARLVRLFGRELLRKRVITAIFLAGILSAVAFFAVDEFWVRHVPRPVSTVSAFSGPGDWAMHGRDITHSAAVAQGSEIQGDLVWRFDTDKPLLSSPAVVDGVVYITTGDFRVLALDAEDGRVIWEQPTTGPVDSSPVVAEETLYIGLRDGRVLALSTETGEEIWSFQIKSPVLSSSIVYQGVLYTGAADDHLYAIDAKTGKKLWSHDTEDWILVTPVIQEDKIVVANQRGRVFVIDIDTGKRRLRYDALKVSNSPAFAGDLLLVATDRGGLRAVDWRKREYPLERTARYWRRHFFIWGIEDKPPVPKGFVWGVKLGTQGATISSPAVADGTAYVYGADGRLHALDVDTGEKLWEYNSGHSAHASPVVVGDTVYVGTNDGQIHAVDRETGEGLRVFPAGGSITGQLVVAGDRLYAASRDGSLYVFR